MYILYASIQRDNNMCMLVYLYMITTEEQQHINVEKVCFFRPKNNLIGILSHPTSSKFNQHVRMLMEAKKKKKMLIYLECTYNGISLIKSPYIGFFCSIFFVFLYYTQCPCIVDYMEVWKFYHEIRASSTVFFNLKNIFSIIKSTFINFLNKE